MNTFELIYEQVKKIPEGKVASYGQIATLAGNPRLSRVVGYALQRGANYNSLPQSCGPKRQSCKKLCL